MSRNKRKPGVGTEPTVLPDATRVSWLTLALPAPLCQGPTPVSTGPGSYYGSDLGTVSSCGPGLCNPSHSTSMQIISIIMAKTVSKIYSLQLSVNRDR